MPISTRWLFWTPTLIWASTWHVILYQLAESTPLGGVAWRFALAASMLVAYARWRGQSLRLPPGTLGWVLFTGALQYGVNYAAIYESERHIPSGLEAVLFTLMVFVNAVTGRVFFQRPFTLRFGLCALLGVAGVAMIFWPEVVSTRARPQAGFGLAMGLLAVAGACAGNVMTLKLTARGVGLVPLLAWCMGAASAFLVLVALASGQSLAPGHSVVWWTSLLYLAAFGSVIAFLTYFRLAEREGPGRAALTSVLTPVIALALSALFEGWKPQWLSLGGIALCVGSVWWATRPAAAPAASALSGGTEKNG